MTNFLHDLSSEYWWFSVVLVGLVLAIAGEYVRRFFEHLVKRLFLPFFRGYFELAVQQAELPPPEYWRLRRLELELLLLRSLVFLSFTGVIYLIVRPGGLHPFEGVVLVFYSIFALRELFRALWERIIFKTIIGRTVPSLAKLEFELSRIVDKHDSKINH